ncbi:MAG: CBS domain-containing protein [Verrucomicrobiae bacterium]|nr:CBS domain-containing protein [Verrucomicrobiae bacterium]MCX7722619.1 CBS domain-containing protein [Verrucomicrobiae bacterium]MDW7980065.1 CBS domain-containing protein [Verrucomicrobiales bacterium]
MTEQQHLEQPVSQYARRDFSALNQDMTVAEALEALRKQDLGERIVYFYVVNEAGQLTGVLPVRRLLMAAPDKRIKDVMLTRVVALPETATVLEACERFAMHRFLALPVVDAQRRLIGVVDMTLFTEEIFDLTERDRMHELFEAIGLRAAAMREARPLSAFRYRFPWLLATVASGTVCALLAGLFEATLIQAIVLAFFLTVVLGLGESVSIQSLLMTIRTLHGRRPTWQWFIHALRREVPTALLLGGACGALVATVALVWRGTPIHAALVGASISGAMTVACFWGVTVPATIHALRLDPRIAAGPVTLALTDITTLIIYFGAAALVL